MIFVGFIKHLSLIQLEGANVTHIQHSVHSQIVSNGNKQINNERYLDFLKFALHRIIETASYFESEAKICKNSTVKLFLYFLAGKKRVQHVILEMIAINSKGNTYSFSNYSSIKEGEVKDSDPLSQMSAEFVLKYAQNKAEKDFNLYCSLAALEEDICTKKLLLTLAKISKDFIDDISTGYNRFKHKNSVLPDALKIDPHNNTSL
jgi:rubrerythrin